MLSSFGTWPHLRVPWHCVWDEYKILCVMRGRAFEWGPHSEDSSPATAVLGSSKPVHRPGTDLVCLTWLWLYLRFTSPAPQPISQAGFCTSRLSLFSLRLWEHCVPVVSVCEQTRADFVWVGAGLLVQYQQSGGHGFLRDFFFFNLRFSVYHRIEPCTALSINFMFYEFSVLWTRNPGTQTMCFILGNTAATCSQDPVLLTR